MCKLYLIYRRISMFCAHHLLWVSLMTAYFILGLDRSSACSARMRLAQGSDELQHPELKKYARSGTRRPPLSADGKNNNFGKLKDSQTRYLLYLCIKNFQKNSVKFLFYTGFICKFTKENHMPFDQCWQCLDEKMIKFNIGKRKWEKWRNRFCEEKRYEGCDDSDQTDSDCVCKCTALNCINPRNCATRVAVNIPG